jgi:hypothetical protein
MKRYPGEAMPRTAADVLPGETFARRPGRPDTAGNSVQAWSAGPLFPAVIAVIEHYGRHCDTATEQACIARKGACWQAQCCTLETSRSYELTIGAFREEYASREDAEMVARWVCRDGRIVPERYAELNCQGDASVPFIPSRYAGPDRWAPSRAVDLGGRS